MEPLVVTVLDTRTGAATRAAFLRSPVRLGRRHDAELPLDAPFVSGEHGVLEFDDEAVRYTDLGSRNGTRLDREPLPPHATVTLAPGQVLHLGPLEVSVARALPGAAEGEGEASRPRAAPGALTALLASLAAPPRFETAAAFAAGARAGLVIGRFELRRELGRGGFGVVWEARDLQLGRAVALKLVRAPEAGLARAHRDLLEREAETVAALNHPNIVSLHDVGTWAGGPYLVLELLHGEPLDARLARGPLPVAAALPVATDVARALAHAHAAGVVHRDLKPSNVFITGGGWAKVLDFGLARLVGGGPRPGGGTPRYMAPERRAGAEGDARADVFAAALLLHETLGGPLPDDGAGATALPLPALDGADLPPGLPALLARATARDEALRPADGQAWLDALGRLLPVEPRSK